MKFIIHSALITTFMHLWFVSNYLLDVACPEGFFFAFFCFVFFWPDGCVGLQESYNTAKLPGKTKHTAWLIHVIHSQSMERAWLQWNYSTDSAYARFIRGLPHPQKIKVKTFDPPSFEGVTWVMLLARSCSMTSCTSVFKNTFILSDIQGTAMKDVWEAKTWLI